jgi:MFS family permease
MAIVASALVKLFVRDGPYLQSSARFDPGAVGRVFVHRPTRLATLGYLGHMWELYAVWTWIAAFASASLQAAGPATSAAGGSAVAFVTIASGAIGSAAAGSVADRLGKARIAQWALVSSAICCAVAGFVFQAPVSILVLFAVISRVAVVTDSAQLSALVADHSPRDHVGTALTVQLCGGFLLTMASIRLVPVVAEAIGWQWVFLCLVPGPVAGGLAIRTLTLEPSTAASALVRTPRGAGEGSSAA